MKRNKNELTMYLEIFNDNVEVPQGDEDVTTPGRALFYELVDRLYQAIGQVGVNMKDTDQLLKVDFYVHLKLADYEQISENLVECGPNAAHEGVRD